ncbi:hypothetical protein WN55_10498 [Dufourea novaeangliae]|uniref:C2 domain-containing protein n=1 Tax=Dufourea novaeangliae TaxID=178035 RepID=A0A154P417_DUFNO|nr:hypothetical protein WN55_10498 [Dufourea novaeangliae]
MLSVLFNVFQEVLTSAKVLDEATNLYRPTIRNDQLDVNNNIDATSPRVAKLSMNGPSRSQYFMNRSSIISDTNENCRNLKAMRNGCGARRFCSKFSSRLYQNKRREAVMLSKSKDLAKFTDSGDCTCNSTKACYFNSDNGDRCCNKNSVKSNIEYAFNTSNIQSGWQPPIVKCVTEKDTPVKNSTFNGIVQNNNGQKGVCTMHMTRKLQDDIDRRSYRPWDKKCRHMDIEDELDNGNTLQGYIKQLDRCKELLGNNCVLNTSTGIPVKEIVDHSKVVDPIRYCDIPNTESACSTNCPTECVDALSSVSDTFPLVIGDGQGLMEIHILSLQLLTSAKQILFRESDMCNVSLFINLDLWNQETASTPTLKCPKLNFNSSFVYRIPDLFSFFNYVLTELVMFQVNVYHMDTECYMVAAGKLCIKDILDYPQNKLHYIAPIKSVLPCSLGMDFGQLSLWVRLSCDVKQVAAFKKKLNLPMLPETEMEERSKTRHETVPPSLSQSSQPPPLPHSDPSKINDTSIVEQRTSKDTVPLHDPEMGFHLRSSPIAIMEKKDIITIDDIKHTEETTDENEDSAPSDVPPIIQKVKANPNDGSLSVVEFNTAIRTEPNKPTNLTKDDSNDSMQEVTDVLQEKFRLDMDRHTVQNNILKAMLDETTNPNITFIVVCEPIPEETDSKECVEVGLAYFNVREYALGNEEKIMSLPIHTPDGREQIGLLKVKKESMKVLRQLLEKDDDT